MKLDRAQREAIALCAAWLAICLVWAATRPGWMDEFTTAATTDPARSWRDHMAFWTSDIHPIVYPFLEWAWRSLINAGPQNLFAMRSLGVACTLAALVGGLWLWRANQRSGLSLYALLLVSSPYFLFFPQEARSYFLIASGGIFVSLFLMNAFEARKARPGVSDAASVIIGALLCSTHLVGLLFAGFALTAATGVLAWRRSMAWMWLCGGVLVVVLGPITLFVGLSILEGITNALGNSWLSPRWTLYTLLVSPLMMGVPVLAVLAASLVRVRTLQSNADMAALLTVAVVVAFLAVATLVSFIKPFLMTRYLLSAFAALLAPATVLAQSAIAPRLPPRLLDSSLVRVGGAAACLALGFGLAWFVDSTTRGDFKRPGLAVSAIPACQSASIPFVVLNFVPDRAQTWMRMMKWYAPDPDFVRATPEAVDQAAAHACPVRLWIAQYEPRHATEEVERALGRACAGDSVALQFRHGFLVVDGDAEDVIEAWRGPRRACDAIPTSTSGPLFYSALEDRTCADPARRCVRPASRSVAPARRF